MPPISGKVTYFHIPPSPLPRKSLPVCDTHGQPVPSAILHQEAALDRRALLSQISGNSSAQTASEHLASLHHFYPRSVAEMQGSRPSSCPLVYRTWPDSRLLKAISMASTLSSSSSSASRVSSLSSRLPRPPEVLSTVNSRSSCRTPSASVIHRAETGEGESEAGTSRSLRLLLIRICRQF